MTTMNTATQLPTAGHNHSRAALREFQCHIPNAVVLRISTARTDGQLDNSPLDVVVAVSIRGCRLLDAVVLADDGGPDTVVIQCVRPQGQSATGKIWGGLLANLKGALHAVSIEEEPAACSMKAAA